MRYNCYNILFAVGFVPPTILLSESEIILAPWQRVLFFSVERLQTWTGDTLTGGFVRGKPSAGNKRNLSPHFDVACVLHAAGLLFSSCWAQSCEHTPGPMDNHHRRPTNNNSYFMQRQTTKARCPACLVDRHTEHTTPPIDCSQYFITYVGQMWHTISNLSFTNDKNDNLVC